MDAGASLQRGHAGARSATRRSAGFVRDFVARGPGVSGLLAFLAERRAELLALTGQHLVLVLVSTAIAVAIGLPLGIAMTRRPRLARPLLGRGRPRSDRSPAWPCSAS